MIFKKRGNRKIIFYFLIWLFNLKFVKSIKIGGVAQVVRAAES